MNDEIRKLLTTEVLGECWHEYGNFEIVRKDGAIILIGGCKNCLTPAKKLPLKYKISLNGTHIANNRTFTTLQDFGDLWEALEKKGLLIKFLEGYRVRWIHQEDDENCCWDTRQVVNVFLFVIGAVLILDVMKS